MHWDTAANHRLNELPIAKKAQATAMIRFGNGLHSVDHHILVQAQLDSQDAAIWLQDTIRNLYGHEATLTPVSRQTPTGVVQRFIVRVPKGSAALVPLPSTDLLCKRRYYAEILPMPLQSFDTETAQFTLSLTGPEEIQGLSVSTEVQLAVHLD